ncbi:hypothetical protein DXD79_28015 [Hungatella hathewayi]|uniref:Uncharacterized protein n=1 Tax=Hungatella hathewayi TaxID=154046 RepID=A0A374P0T0_9FIRM|nr:hypothetical protein DXD79_28015 [Hungatella hathewayi]RGK90775.1 hypothetical protein DXC88_26440 [Hungatella hathewayi]RHC46019.1 hypothetical protein DW841_23685 [Hungatella hathewayi]
MCDLFNKINENSPSLYRWEMNRKNKLSGSGGQISPTDMRSKQSGNRIKWQHSYYANLGFVF